MTETVTNATGPAIARQAAPGTSRQSRRRARPGVVLAIVLTGQFMALLDASIVNVATPAIHASLQASGAALQMIVAGYTITYAVLLVTGARLGDLLGHARMFRAGLVVFTLSSLGCGLATSAGLLITLRFVQGVGAATMIPQVLSLIQRTFTGAQRARAMSLYAAVISGGAVVGQVAGGLLITADLFGTGWRPVFLVNVPVGAVLLAGARVLPADRGEPGRGLDLPGLLTLSPAVLAFVVPLVLGHEENWPLWGWLCLGSSALLLTVFVFAERAVARRGGAPIMPGRILRLPGMALSIAALFTVMASYGGFLFAFALHLQGGLGESALRAGLTFAPGAAGFAIASLNWRRIPARGHNALILAGFLLGAACYLGLAIMLGSGGTGGVGLYLLMGLYGLCMGSSFSPLITSVLMRVPVAAAADASGLIVTVNQLGLVTGVAAFGTIYLDLAGRLPVHLAAGTLRHASAHAEALMSVALAATAIAGAVCAALRLRGQRTAQPPVAQPPVTQAVES